MHVLTLNCHSWVEENSLEKLQQLVDTIVKEKFDVLLLQEVNQRIGSEPEILDDRYLYLIHITEPTRRYSNSYAFFC